MYTSDISHDIARSTEKNVLTVHDVRFDDNKSNDVMNALLRQI